MPRSAPKLFCPPPGTVFGSFSVVRPASPSPHNGATRALVQCSCGSARRAVAVSLLLRGRARHCVHCAPRRGRAIQDPSALAEIGSVWTRLTVLEHRREDGRRVVLCACTCGARPKVLLDNLTSGNTQSCGCLANELRRQANARRRSPLRKLQDELARHLSPDQIAGALVRVTPEGVEVTIPARRAA